MPIPENGGSASSTKAARTSGDRDAERLGEAGADAGDLPSGGVAAPLAPRGARARLLGRFRSFMGSPPGRSRTTAPRGRFTGGALARRAPEPAVSQAAPPGLRRPSPATRARGRRLAIASHPAGMTFRTVFTEWVPTLALVGLGASAAVVGLQSAFDPLGHLVQLGVLRAVGRCSKRPLLIGGQVAGRGRGLPLLAYGSLPRSPGPWRSRSCSRASRPSRSASRSPTPSGFRCCARTSSPARSGASSARSARSGT